MDNLNTTWKQGEVGKEIEFTLRADGALYNLDNWTITLTIAEDQDTAPVLTDLAVTARTQSGATLGKCYHVLTDTVGPTTGSAQLTPKKYAACELKLVNGTDVRYWPVDENDRQTYFTCTVKRSLS